MDRGAEYVIFYKNLDLATGTPKVAKINLTYLESKGEWSIFENGEGKSVQILTANIVRVESAENGQGAN